MKTEIKTFQLEDLEPEVGVVVGTRPGIIMFAPIIHELRASNLRHFLVHTGQHYSPHMDAQFFDELELPRPDYRVDGVQHKITHGGQTAAMLEGVEKVLLERKPWCVLVGGDANTNLAGALAARKLHIRVAHVEAGERSFDWRMPEEHNRVIIDHISDYLFATGEKAVKNLKAESIRGRICVTGNTIVDASMHHLKIALARSNVLERNNLKPRKYALVTIHREENVDNKERLAKSLRGVSAAAAATGLPVFFPAHPRTLKRLREFNLLDWANSLPYLSLETAFGYFDFINVVAHAALVYTDSGGVQQEACIHQVPCITLRENTEWIETLEAGANRLAGCEPDRIVAAAMEAMKNPRQWRVPFGDGDAAKKIVQIIKDELEHAYHDRQ